MAYWVTTATPVPVSVAATISDATIFALVMNMACKTPSDRTAALAEAMPAAAAVPPAANETAAEAVVATSAAAGAAVTAFVLMSDATATADSATPRRVRRAASNSRPRDRRL